MVSEGRWKDAQRYEQGYWDQVAAEAEAEGQGRLGGYKWRSDQLVRMLGQAGAPEIADGSSRVLEVGSGPIGVIGFFPATERVAVDPLEDFYSSKPALVASRNPEVSYRQGAGEALPVDDGHYDLVMIENCIDHCRDMDAVMTGIRRALRPQGYLYLTVNARCRPGYYMHRALSRLEIDPGHPHTFTQARVRCFLRDSGFDVLHLEHGSFLEAWLDDFKGPGLKKRVKGLLGVSEYLVSVIAVARD
jgi:SAM-dependent methyltransferase